MAGSEKKSSGKVLRILTGATGGALLMVGVALAAVFGIGRGNWTNWANAAVFALPLVLLGCALLHVSRRPRRWPLAVAAALIAILVPFGTLLWASANHFGSEPEYEVGSMQELRADLSDDCPGIRFPDLARYEGEGSITYKILYHGGRLSMRYRSYWITFGRQDGFEGEDAASGGMLPATLSVLSRDMRSFDDDGTVALQVKPNMELSGVDVERNGGILRFIVGDYLYEVSAGGRAAGESAEEVEARSEESFEAACIVALSIIEQ